MLTDLVIDTNVLLHAENPGEIRYSNAIEFISTVKNSLSKVRVDEGYSINIADNRSRIGHEYLDKLRFGMLGFALIVFLAKNERLIVVSTTVSNRERRIINQEVRDPTDRVFVKVAVNSEEHILVSHDFSDFPERVCNNLLRKIGVEIIDCATCIEYLS